MEQQAPLKKKPEWLERLEQESYQAELIISGIAIFGTLQLPNLIKRLVMWSLDTFSQDFMTLGYLLFIYLILASELLIVNFVSHFLLRTLWIGNIGLASVFPNGIKYNSDKFGKDYGEKLAKAFPDFGAFNKRLDDICSVMFAIASLFGMIFLSISLFLGLAGVLAYLISLPFEQLDFWTVGYGIGAIFLVLFVTQSLLALPALRERAWVKRIHFPLSMFSAKLLYGPFYKPVNYITNIFLTNSKGYWSIGLMMLYMFVVGFFSFPLIESTRILFSNEKYQEKVRLSSSRMRFYNYDDQRPEGEYIPFASIPAEVIRGTVMPVFVNLRPDPENFVDDRCENEDIDVPKEKSHAWVDCLQRYYHFYLGDQRVTPTGLYTYKREDNRQYGIRAFLPMKGVGVGGQELRITFDGPEVDSTLRHDILIPFQYYPEEQLSE